LLADLGYQAVALTPDVCHLDPYRSTAAEIDAIAALLAQLRLQPVIETGARFLLDPRQKHEPTLMTRDDAARRVRLDYCRRAAGLGAALGAGVVSFWTGVDRAPGVDSPVRLRDGVRAAADVIRGAGLVPALEPEPGMAVATVAQWRALAAALGGEAPALTLDVGHLHAEWEGEPAAVIAGCGRELVQVHLEDMRRGVHEHLLPGDGDVDFHSVAASLRRAGYRGPVCFELSRHSHLAPTAVAACAGLWGQLGGDVR
jgi:sugar phosphate isomerase/epimerase